MNKNKWISYKMLEQDDVVMILEEVQNQIRIMQSYIEMQMNMEEWHGIMDAAADMRELKAKEKILLEVLGAK